MRESRKSAVSAVCFLLIWTAGGLAQAQTNPTLMWDGDGAAIVTGYAVTIDGVRTNLGLAPIPGNGLCGCSTPLTLNGGRHTVIVTAYNSHGESQSAPLIVEPIADAGGPYTGQIGSAITVSGASSIAPTGTLTNYTWRWGDGSADTSSSSASASHVYSASGTFTLTLTVTDNAAATGSASTSVTVSSGLPPGTPTSPSPSNGATGVATNATLTWSAAGATSYDVSFGITNPPPQVSTGQASASYQPSTLTAGVAYYWRVVARNSAGSTTGPVWLFTTASGSSLPAPWQTQDIGAVGPAGSASHSGGQFTVTGSGGDMWGLSDAFRYVYQPLAGDGQITARVTSVQNTNVYAGAGVMIRESLSANAVHAFALVRPSGGVDLRVRSTTGGRPVSLGATTQVLPTWLRLMRTGSTIVASVSPNGTAWTVVGTTTIAMTASVWVGLGVTSHDLTVLNTSTFDTVTVATGSGTQPPATPTSPTPATGATGVAANAALTWSATGATAYDVSFGTSNPPSQVSTAQSTASYQPATMTAGTTYYWRVVARNSAGSTTGPVWSFTTAATPATPTSPSPGSGATGVAATATLTWNATGATSYDVSFGITNPPPQVSTGQASASYQPSTLTAGVAYYWRVVARNSAGSTTGPVWSFTTAAADSLPAPWQTQDVGAVGVAGSASHAGGQFTVAGAGADIWGTADAFRFVYQPLSGDGTIIARVTAIQNTHLYAKAGVMIRESLNANARHAIVTAIPNNGVQFLTRTTAGDTTTQLSSVAQAIPAWIRLARTGSSIVASVSADGSAWSVVGTANVTMAASVLVGLAVTSHNVTALNTSTFDSVSVVAGSGTQPPATPTSPTPANGATAVATDATLTWSAVGATSYDVSFGTTNPPPQVATGQPAASYQPASTSGGTIYYWRVVARNSGGTTTGPLWSFTTAAPPTGGPVPPPWLNQDIGAVGQFGWASYTAGPPPTFTVAGSGADISGTADAFHYVHRLLNGDSEIVARVVSLQNTHPYAKAGIMIRAGLENDAAHVILSVRPGGGVELLARADQGASTTTAASAAQSPPAWLRLVRAGSIVTAYVSSNGSAWTQVGSAGATFGVDPYAGLAVTSHNASVLNSAMFDSVAIAAGSPIPGPGSNGDVVIYASDVPAAARHGSWQTAGDALSPNGVKLTTLNAGLVYANAPLANPQHYVDVTFNAYAATPYRIWLRLRATSNQKANDSVWVQLSDGLVSGSPVYSINTTSGLVINLATGNSGNSLRNWGWQGGAYWLRQPSTVTFASTGMHTIRIQVREDGVQLDQIVLSPGMYLNSAPGPTSNDTTIVPK